MHTILFYDLADDYLTRRAAYRSPCGIVPDVQIVPGTSRRDPIAAFE